jgi:hypothetical protein
VNQTKLQSLIDAAKRAVCQAIDDAAEDIGRTCDATADRYAASEIRRPVASLGASLHVMLLAEPQVVVKLRGADKWQAEACAEATAGPALPGIVEG